MNPRPRECVPLLDGRRVATAAQAQSGTGARHPKRDGFAASLFNDFVRKLFGVGHDGRQPAQFLLDRCKLCFGGLLLIAARSHKHVEQHRWWRPVDEHGNRLPQRADRDRGRFPRRFIHIERKAIVRFDELHGGGAV